MPGERERLPGRLTEIVQLAFCECGLVERLPKEKVTALGEKTVNQTVFTRERIDIRYALAELARDKTFVESVAMKIRGNILCSGELGGVCCQWNAYH